MLYAKGVLADEYLSEMLDSANHRLFAAGQTGLAYAEDAFVGIDDYEEKVAMAGPDRIGGNVGNFHWTLLGNFSLNGFALAIPEMPTGARGIRVGLTVVNRRRSSPSQLSNAGRQSRMLVPSRYPAKPTRDGGTSQADRLRGMQKITIVAGIGPVFGPLAVLYCSSGGVSV